MEMISSFFLLALVIPAAIMLAVAELFLILFLMQKIWELYCHFNDKKRKK